MTYDNIHTVEYYNKRVYDIQETEKWDPVVRSPEEAPQKIAQALLKAYEDDEKIPIGVFYQNPTVPTFEERLNERLQSYTAYPPAVQGIERDGAPVIGGEDFERIFSKYVVSTG